MSHVVSAASSIGIGIVLRAGTKHRSSSDKIAFERQAQVQDASGSGLRPEPSLPPTEPALSKADLRPTTSAPGDQPLVKPDLIVFYDEAITN